MNDHFEEEKAPIMNSHSNDNMLSLMKLQSIKFDEDLQDAQNKIWEERSKLFPEINSDGKIID